MQAIFYHPSADFSLWQKTFATYVPELTLYDYKQGMQDLDSSTIEFALVWAPPTDMLKQYQNLRGVFVLGAGVDALLSKAAVHQDYLPQNIPIMRIEDGGMAQQMIEYSLSRIFHYFRRFDVYEKQQRNHVWHPVESFDYDNFTIGILGAGILGSAVATALVAQGFNVKTYSRTSKMISGTTNFSGENALSAFLSGTKVLINLLPNTPHTQGLIDAKLLKQLEKGSYLINLARGVHVVEADLLDLLETGHIAGVSLDVFCEEPLKPSHSFWQHENVFITPHIAAVTKLKDAALQIGNNIKALNQKGSLTGLVDQTRGY